MTLTVLYFAAAREQAGTARESIELAAASVGELLNELCRRHPGLSRVRPHLRVAVNQQLAAENDAVPAGAEVALIPPVAGGSGEPRILSRPLALDDVVRQVAGPERGGLVTFTGSVRGETRGRRVLRLEYEAYAPMVERALDQISREAAERWPGTQLAIQHRVGTLLPGDLAVVIAAASPHRAAAFRACEHAIERLKQDAPIWKKEIYDDGEVWVGMGP